MKRTILCALLMLFIFTACSKHAATDAPTHPLTEEQWLAAFAAENFVNVTLKSYWDDTDQSDPEIVCMDDKNGLVYFTGSSGSADSEGNSYHTKYENYFYWQDGVGRILSKATTTHQPSGEVTVKWGDVEASEDESVTASDFAQILCTLEWDFSAEENDLSKRYDAFTYDVKAEEYRGTLTERIERGEDYDALVYTYHITVRFDGAQISEIKYYRVFENESETSPLHSYYLSDYGTTVVELPEQSVTDPSVSDEPSDCQHTYTTATCSVPKICTKCEHIAGHSLPHHYVDGVCTVCRWKEMALRISQGDWAAYSVEEGTSDSGEILSLYLVSHNQYVHAVCYTDPDSCIVNFGKVLLNEKTYYVDYYLLAFTAVDWEETDNTITVTSLGESGPQFVLNKTSETELTVISTNEKARIPVGTVLVKQ